MGLSYVGAVSLYVFPGGFLAGALHFIYLFIWLFRAAPIAYGGSQARGQILRHSHRNIRSIQAVSATYTTAHGNTRSLTH